MLMAPISPLPAAKTKKPPVSETIRKVGSGANSGEMDITLMKSPGAVADEVRWGVPGAGRRPARHLDKHDGHRDPIARIAV